VHLVGFTIEINYDMMFTRKYKNSVQNFHFMTECGHVSGHVLHVAIGPISHSVSQLS